MSRGPRYYEESIGKKFHSLTVERFIGFATEAHGHRRGRWLCRCDCGGQITVSMQNLQNENNRSCGCTKRGKLNKRWKGCGDLGMTVWSQFINGAKDRNIPFDLTIEWGWWLYESQKGACALTGWPIGFGTERRRNTASLDRIDSAGAYVQGNVQWVHKDINRMKVDFDEAYFVSACKAIAALKK